MSEKATVTIPLEDYMQITREREDAHELIAELQTSLAVERNAHLHPHDQQFAVGLLAAKEIVSFAVGNLSPETTRGWPWSDLVVFAQKLLQVPTLTPHAKEQAEEFIRFAREAEQLERSRKS